MLPSRFHSLLKNPQIRERLESISASNKSGLTADEFLSFLPTRIKHAGTTGYKTAMKMGVKAKTADAFKTPLPATLSCMSLCMALVGRGISIEDISESHDGCSYVVSASIPSSPLHWQGKLEASVCEIENAAEVSLNVVFPGQIFAWGAGSKIINQLRTECLNIFNSIKPNSEVR